MTIRQRRTQIAALPSQQRFFASTAFTKGFSGPVGSGKTYALCYEALQCTARNPGRVGLIGAPTYPMLRDVTLTTMREILEEKRIPYSYLKQENVLTLLRSKSKILFRSLERFENLRGPNLAWVGVDELTLHPAGGLEAARGPSPGSPRFASPDVRGVDTEGF